MVIQHPPSQNPAAARDNPSDVSLRANAQLESQRGWSGSHPLLSVLLNHMQEVIRRYFSIVPWTLSRAWYTGTVPIGTGEALMMAVRISSKFHPWRDPLRSAPYFTARFSFSTSSSRLKS